MVMRRHLHSKMEKERSGREAAERNASGPSAFAAACSATSHAGGEMEKS